MKFLGISFRNAFPIWAIPRVLHPGCVENVLELGKDGLRGFWSQVGNGTGVISLEEAPIWVLNMRLVPAPQSGEIRFQD